MTLGNVLSAHGSRFYELFDISIISKDDEYQHKSKHHLKLIKIEIKKKIF